MITNNFFIMAKSKNIIVKSNSLVEARYKFSIWETRVFAKMVTMINKEDQEFKTYAIDIKDLMDFYGTKSNNDYERIREVPESLLKKIIKIPYINDKGEKRLFKTTLIAGSDEPDESTLSKTNTTLELTFHPTLKSHLLGLKEKFLTYDIRNTLRISSANSIHVYELLKQYEKIKKRAFELEELKEVLGLEGKYKKYSHFKAKILEKAQEHLKTYSDIWFTYKPESRGKGKAITHIVFSIYPNKPKESVKGITEQFDIFESPSTPLEKKIDNVIVVQLIEVGIPKTAAQSLFQQGFDIIVEESDKAIVIERCNNDAEKYFEEKLALVKNNREIKNPAGYLVSALKMDWKSPVAAKQKKEKKAKKKIQDRRKRKMELDAELENVRKEWSDKNFDICCNLIESEKDCLDKVYHTAVDKAGTMARTFLPKKEQALEIFHQRTMGYAMMLSAFFVEYPKAFEELDNHYQPKEDAVKAELEKLRYF